MSPAVSREERLLDRARASLDEVLADHADRDRARLEILEACAARIGGFSLRGFRGLWGEEEIVPEAEALLGADAVLPALEESPIDPALALTALARPAVDARERRSGGVYYTDWRLARHLAGGMLREHRSGDLVIDPASGTGILLVAMALSLPSEEARTEFVGSSACAADLSPLALRGARLALASLTGDLAAVARLGSRLRAVDSLQAGPAAWGDVAPHGFDTVIGNPPWEKLKLSRHEHLLDRGVSRRYGEEYGDADLAGIDLDRERLLAYARRAGDAYALHGGGEPDLYKLFLALAIDLARPDGQLGMLVPAGLIRSEGTEALRRYLFGEAGALRIEISDNRARHFSIDTRFKFLAVRATLRGRRKAGKTLALGHLSADAGLVARESVARIDRRQLERLRPDLTVPEVRSGQEWDLFRRMSAAGPALGDGSGPWRMEIVRELDMTRDRRLFARERGAGAIPLVEGRMVHQFRHAAKSFVSGMGRSAIWDLREVGSRDFDPQFWVDPGELGPQLRERIAGDRIGFCDITGQTNERTMLAARIPAGTVCNNKVPTISFGGEAGLGELGWLWLGIANSFAFDWLLRRVMTTTLNYFILRSLSFPEIAARGSRDRIVELAQAVERGYHGESEADELSLGSWRAELDALVFRAYGLAVEEAEEVIGDFPLLDRGQPALDGEPASTLTRDLVLAALVDLDGGTENRWRERADAALLAGAQPYVPGQLGRSRVKAAALAGQA